MTKEEFNRLSKLENYELIDIVGKLCICIDNLEKQNSEACWRLAFTRQDEVDGRNEWR